MADSKNHDHASIADLLRYLMPSVLDGARPTWPPDAFALVASVLKRSGAYTEVANRWPPSAYRRHGSWHNMINLLANKWRNTCNRCLPWPDQIEKWWNVVLANKDRAFESIVSNRRLVIAMIGIVAAADHACFNAGFLLLGEGDEFDDRTVRNLSIRQSLCEKLHETRAIVLPKCHNPLTGMTLRSLTHNLALWNTPEVSPTWEQIGRRRVEPGMNILLLPWPLVVMPNAFRAVDADIGLTLPHDLGLFSYDMPGVGPDIRKIEALVEAATKLGGDIDAIVFPELSMTANDFAAVLDVVNGPILIAGVGEAQSGHAFGANEVAVAVDSAIKSDPFCQSKHHRWRIDPAQLAQYGLAQSMTAREAWWEAIRVESRECRFFSSSEWLTFCVLVCEDLARQDPVADLVRCVGPNLVIALLLDGPQIPDRWPARYATVLAEDPRSSVLTLTCAGMVDLARSQFGGGLRSVGLWKDAYSNARPIVLEPGSEAVLLKLNREMTLEWTAAGRHDYEGTGYLKLAGIYQVTTTIIAPPTSKTTARNPRTRKRAKP